MNNSAIVSHWLPCPVVFISTAFQDKRDIMTATAMFVSEKEPLVNVSVAKEHLTTKLIEQAGGFFLIIASENQKELANQLGSVQGDVEDKFKRFSISTLTPEPGKPLIPAGSAAWFECTVVNSQEMSGYVVLTARVINQEELGNPPLLWQKGKLFGLKQL
jgi:flavin reductase (DIM6/NTAB) family NADH-FMN oxidoreductase RutF